jgi:hypothetical protein
LAEGASQEEMPEIAAEILSASNKIAATVQRLRRLGVPDSVDYLGQVKMLDLSAEPLAKPKKKAK